MALVETSGKTSATPASRSGQTAPNKWAEAKRCSRTPRGRTPLWYQTWVTRPFCPTRLDAARPTVREPELHPRRLGVPSGSPADQPGQGFLKRSRAFGSASGWTGRAFCRDKSRRFISRAIPLSP